MSGSTVGGILGGAIGFWIGGPMGAQIGFALGSYAGAVADPTKIQGPTLGDLPIQTAMEGAPRPIVYGRPQPFFGNLLQSGDYNPYTVETENGGKGPTSVTVGQGVRLTYAIRICEGPATVIRAWRDERLVYDATGAGVIAADMQAIRSKTMFYTGSEDQNPDPSLEAIPEHRGGGIGNVPSYRGTAYMVVTEDDLGNTGRIPQWKFEMASNATVTETCGTAGGLWHFPLNDAVPGGVATEVISGRNGVYIDSETIGGSSSIYVLGSGSTSLGATSDTIIATSTETFSAANLDEFTIRGSFTLEDEDEGGVVWKNVCCNWGDPITGKQAWGFVLMPDSNVLRFRAYSTPIAALEIDGPNVSANIPHRVAVTWSAATEIVTLYYDGIAVASQADVPAGFFKNLGLNTIEWGGGNYSGHAYGFIGKVQDWEMLNVAQDAQEVFNDYLTNPEVVRESPDAPGTYVRRIDGHTISICTISSEIDSFMLSEAITDICQREGIDPAEINVTADEDVPIDYLVGALGTTGVSAILPLAMANFRDYVDIDGQLVSVERGGEVVEDLVSADFLVSDKDEDSLRQKVEIPRRLNVGYWDREAGARLLAFAERESQNVPSEGAPQIELPMVLGRDLATQKTHVLLKIMSEEAQGRINRVLPLWKYAHLTDSDPITVDGKRHRIERTSRAGGRMEIEAVRDRVSNYSSTATAGQAIDPATPVSSHKGPTWLQALNLPRLRSADNQPGMYVAATGATEGWPGAYLLMSTDGGATFKQAVDVSGQPITFGVRALMGHVVTTFDTDDEPITVQTWDNRDLVSVTDAQLAARQNAMAVTTDGVSEIIQFKDAEESDTVEHEFDLTTVGRGMLDTDAAIHQAEDEVLVLDGAIKFTAIPVQFAGQEIIFRAVTRGTPVESNPTITVTFAPQFTGPETIDFYTNASGEKYTDEFGAYYYRE